MFDIWSYGERVTILGEQEYFYYIEIGDFGLRGYISDIYVQETNKEPTHIVTHPSTLLFSKEDIKSRIPCLFHWGQGYMSSYGVDEEEKKLIYVKEVVMQQRAYYEHSARYRRMILLRLQKSLFYNLPIYGAVGHQQALIVRVFWRFRLH